VKGLQFLSHKRKEPPCKSSEKFCRVKRRQNESGVLQGGKNLYGEQILAVLHFSTKLAGFAIKGIMDRRARQDVFANFIAVKR